MATASTSEFRSGMKFMQDGDPCVIIDNEFVKPGKGQAFNRVKFRNLKTGRTLEKTFKSGETVELADVVDVEMQYLYHDGVHWHFMAPENFEQHEISEAIVATQVNGLKKKTCVLSPCGMARRWPLCHRIL